MLGFLEKIGDKIIDYKDRKEQRALRAEQVADRKALNEARITTENLKAAKLGAELSGVVFGSKGKAAQGASADYLEGLNAKDVKALESELLEFKKKAVTAEGSSEVLNKLTYLQDSDVGPVQYKISDWTDNNSDPIKMADDQEFTKTELRATIEDIVGGVRHERFGATLTGNELESFRKQFQNLDDSMYVSKLNEVWKRAASKSVAEAGQQYSSLVRRYGKERIDLALEQDPALKQAIENNINSAERYRSRMPKDEVTDMRSALDIAQKRTQEGQAQSGSLTLSPKQIEAYTATREKALKAGVSEQQAHMRALAIARTVK